MKYEPKMNLDALQPADLKSIEKDMNTPRSVWLYCVLRRALLESLRSRHHRRYPEVAKEQRQLCEDARAQIPSELDW